MSGLVKKVQSVVLNKKTIALAAIGFTVGLYYLKKNSKQPVESYKPAEYSENRNYENLADDKAPGIGAF